MITENKLTSIMGTGLSILLVLCVVGLLLANILRGGSGAVIIVLAGFTYIMVDNLCDSIKEYKESTRKK